MPRPPPDALRASSRAWGGMDAGEGMLYPSQSVDGVIHALSGTALRDLLEAVPSRGADAAGQPLRCDVGDAVITPAVGGSRDAFDWIAHAVPPFWSDEHWESRLRSSFVNSLVGLCRRLPLDASLWVASPLLGAGARGAPPEEAARVAVSELCAQVLAGRLCDEDIGSAPAGVWFRLVVPEPALHARTCTLVEDEVRAGRAGEGTCAVDLDCVSADG